MNLFSKCAASLALACALLAPLSASASIPEDYISVSVNGNVLYLDQNPVLRNGTTLVPMRAIFEALGATIKWDSATKTVTANTATDQELMANPDAPNTKIVLTINQDSAQVDGNPVKLLEPARIIAGNTMVPLRFVGEAMGADVKWYGSERIIRIAQKDSGITLPDPKEVEEKAKEIDKDSLWNIDANLKRLQIGAQGGIIKVLDEKGKNPIYIRIDLDAWHKAPYLQHHRKEVCDSLGIKDSELENLAVRLISNFETYRKNYQQLILLLSLLSGVRPHALTDETRNRSMAFVVEKLNNGYGKFDANMQNVLKRQCIISLALMKDLSPKAIEAVIKCYETESNNYILAAMPLFFRQHAEEIKALPNGQDLVLRVNSVKSMYSAQVADALK